MPNSIGAVVRPFDATRDKLYVGDITHNSIDIYPAGTLNPKRIGTITKGVSSPTNVAVGATTPYRAFGISSRYPNSIAVGPSGTIYVMS